MAARKGKLVYHHYLEHDASKCFVEIEARKKALHRRTGFFGDPGEWSQTERFADTSEIFPTTKRILGELEAKGYEAVYLHEPSSEFRRFQHPETGRELELDIDYDAVLKRERAPGEHVRWQQIQFDWQGPATEAFEEEVEAATSAGFVLAERQTLLQTMLACHGDLPESYRRFLEEGGGADHARSGVRGVPEFGERWLWPHLTSPSIPWADAPNANTLVISDELREAAHLGIDPHPVRLAILRDSDAVVLVGDGAITPAWPSFAAFVSALTPE